MVFNPTIIVLIVIGWISFVSTFNGKIFIATLALKLPIIGKMNIKTNSVRITRTLSTLITAGIPLIEAVDIAARTIDNLVIKKVLMESKEEIARGVPLSVPINSSGIFPPLVTQMMKIGEETGSMDDMLNKIADYYDEEVEAATVADSNHRAYYYNRLAVVVGGMIIAVTAYVLNV